MSIPNFLKSSATTNHDVVMLILRILFGGFMLMHGYPKLMKLLAGNLAFADPIGLGAGLSLGLTVFAEFLCALLVLFGLGTRIACIPLIITMLVAAFVIHGADPIGDKELALIYLGGYLAIFLGGGGKFSLDRFVFK